MPDTRRPLGLKRVAALEKWSDPTRNLALSLFGENAPIGDYPAQQGYEPIIVRLMKEAQLKQFGALEPYSAALWKAAIYTDDHRRYYGANAWPWQKGLGGRFSIHRCLLFPCRRQGRCESRLLP